VGRSIKKNIVILKKQLINIQIIIFVFIQLLLFGNIENVIAQEFKKHPVILSLHRGISPFVRGTLQRSSSISVGLFKLKNTFIGLNIASFSSCASINFSDSYSDPRINTHFLHPPPPSIYYLSENIMLKTPSFGLCFFKLDQHKKVNTLFYASINIMNIRVGSSMGLSEPSFKLFPFYSAVYDIKSKPTFELLVKYSFIAKKEKRMNFTVSPFVRYAYLNIISMSYSDYTYKQFTSFNTLYSHTKNLFTTGITFDFFFLRKKKSELLKQTEHR